MALKKNTVKKRTVPKKVDPNNPTVESGFVIAEEHRETYEFYLRRKEELLQSRRNIHGKNLDTMIRDAEKNYQPHTVQIKDPRTINNSQPNLLIKVNTALNVVLTTNDLDAILAPAKKKYRKTNEIIKSLYVHSLDPQVSASRQQYYNAAFNLFVHGWTGLRTFRNYMPRSVRGADNKTMIDVVDIDEVDCEALHPADFWIDDMAKPGNRWSINDWIRRKVYSYESFRQDFPEEKFPDVKYVGKGGNTQIHLQYATQGSTGAGPYNTTTPTRDQVEVYFYENKRRDLLIIEANRIPFCIIPLPQENKQLSLSFAYHILRSTDTAYGIGLWEIIMQDQQLIDMVRDMSVEQLSLAIFSMIFHNGENPGLDAKKLKVEAGAFYKFLNPEKIKQFQLNPPDDKVIQFLKMFQQDLEDSSGVAKVLQGQPLGKTAFEANLNQEASLRRLKTPAENLKSLFEWEASNRIDMIKQLYSIPKVTALTDPEEMEAYKAELIELGEGKIDPDLYYVDENDVLYKKQYREVALNLQQSPSGELMPSSKSAFFTIKPKMLDWKGTITIKMESLMLASKVLLQQQKTEMATFIAPFIDKMAQLPQAAQYYVPFLTPFILANNEMVDDWIPEQLLQISEDAHEQFEQQQQQKAQQEAAKSQTAAVPGQPARGVPGAPAVATGAEDIGAIPRPAALGGSQQFQVGIGLGSPRNNPAGGGMPSDTTNPMAGA
jgi:hypothetical protein